MGVLFTPGLLQNTLLQEGRVQTGGHLHKGDLGAGLSLCPPDLCVFEIRF